MPKFIDLICNEISKIDCISLKSRRLFGYEILTQNEISAIMPVLGRVFKIEDYLDSNHYQLLDTPTDIAIYILYRKREKTSSKLTRMPTKPRIAA